MNSPNELQIANVLSVASSQLVYCEVILDYPKKFNKNYKPSSDIDNFWMNIRKVFFNDSLLLTATLLDKDPRTISFFNWQDFVQLNEPWLQQQVDNFKNFGLRTVRDQVVGHVDTSNPNNRLPSQRRQGNINEILVSNLGKAQQALIDKFDEFTRNNNNSPTYSRVNFFGGGTARHEVEIAMNLAKPELTGDPVVC